MNKFRVSLFLLLAVTSLGAQHVPKFVVCITVDQLRGDYLEYLSHTFGERGFKRLMYEGVVFGNVRFEFPNIDGANAFATLFTGSNPSSHGISAEKRFDFSDNRELPMLNDPDFLGNYTRDNYSPVRLRASTIGDELKIASLGMSNVFAIAPNAQCAILSAGHAANGAFWLDESNGKWATTTYYPAVPWYVEQYNGGTESLSARMERLEWTPALPVAQYNAFPYVVNELPFRYTFSEKDRYCYANFKTSPLVNEEVNRLAMQFLEHAAFGSRACPDMLSVTYYAGNYSRLADKEYTLEIQDAYFRLDKNIEQLLDAIDKKVGLAHTLIVFTGSGYYQCIEEYAGTMRLNAGEFYPKRCVALLNMYLMQLYGQKNWVKGYYNKQIFFDRKAVEDSQLSLEEIQGKAAAFVEEFSGVQSVTTDFVLRNGNRNEGTDKFYNGTHHLGRGDLIIELQPGWKINYETRGEKVSMVRHNAVITPLSFMGNGLKPARIDREVKATEIAPTIAHLLRTRPPNAARRLPLIARPAGLPASHYQAE
jgi:hypothetical protein